MEKTQATRVLDARGIAYELNQYDASGEFHSGAEAAELLGVDAASVYKTLVVLRDGNARARPMLVVAPVECEIDLKVLATSVGAKKLRMAKQREAEQLTGMQVGGISALALQRPEKFEVLLDESARGIGKIHVSAGRRGLDVALAVEDFVAVAGAAYVRATARR